jgi:hypothetical protein
MKEEEEEDGSEAEEEDNDIEETEEYEEEEDEETSGYPPQLEIVRAPEQQASKCADSYFTVFIRICRCSATEPSIHAKNI